MQIRRLYVVASIGLVTACGRADTALPDIDPVGCYALATGPISWWRPQSLLQTPSLPAPANFYLAAGREPLRFLDKWGVMLNQDTTQNPMGSANWRVNTDRSFTLTSFQVDWGYKITLISINQDSVRGIAKFAGDGANGRARVVGHRIPCIALPPVRR